MISYPDYKKATNAAYNLLVKKRSFSFSTNVFSIVEDVLSDCKLLTYGQACLLYGATPNLLAENSTFGFTIIDGDRRIILYNEECSIGCIRFTIAHEIGHAVLGHAQEHDPVSEKEANCFARNLLCPIPVALGLSLDTKEEYANMFNVTEQMAAVSFDKRRNDRYHIDDTLFEAVSDMLDAYMMGFESVDLYYRHLAS